MKHLKSYSIFESSFMKKSYSEEVVIKTDEIISNIKDILLELSDQGYTSRVDYKVIPPRLVTSHPEIQIYIAKLGEDSQNLPLWNNEDEKSEFYDVIARLLTYAVTEGYKYEYSGNVLKSFDLQKTPVPVSWSVRLYKEKE